MTQNQNSGRSCSLMTLCIVPLESNSHESAQPKKKKKLCWVKTHENSITAINQHGAQHWSGSVLVCSMTAPARNQLSSMVPQGPSPWPWGSCAPHGALGRAVQLRHSVLWDVAHRKIRRDFCQGRWESDTILSLKGEI